MALPGFISWCSFWKALGSIAWCLDRSIVERSGCPTMIGNLKYEQPGFRFLSIHKENILSKPVSNMS